MKITIENFRNEFKYVELCYKTQQESEYYSHVKMYSDGGESDKNFLKRINNNHIELKRQLIAIKSKCDIDKIKVLQNTIQFKPCPISIYNKFLKGYFKCGGTYTHEYYYNLGDFPLWNTISKAIHNVMLSLHSGIHLPKYGSNSRIIVVPKNIDYIVKDSGHDTIMYMKDYNVIGSFIPVYKDTIKNELHIN